MTHIIAGGLQQQEQVQEIIDELQRAAFSENDITSFYLNPPGQHDLLPLGGDRENSPGTKDSGTGSAVGIAGGGIVGAVVGLAGLPVLGVLAPALGAAVGSHVGSLVGSFAEMRDKGDAEADGENRYEQRKSGMMVGVNVIDAGEEQIAIRILRSFGAQHIERSEGNIVNGEWLGFNPIAIPVLIDAVEDTVE
jgi:hypothetical protein